MRTVRNLNDLTKQKISQSVKQTKQTNPVSPETKRKISIGLKKYWSTIPTVNPDTKENNKNNKIPTL